MESFLIRLRHAAAIAVLILTSSRLQAAIIDTFTVPDYDESVTSSSANSFSVDSTTQTPLSTFQVIDGERYFEVGTNSVAPGDSSASVTATMNGFTADPDFDVTMTSPDSGVFESYAMVVWGNTNPLNFDAGTDTDFLLTLEDLAATSFAVDFAQFILEVETGSGTDVVTIDALDAGGFLSPTYRFSGLEGIDFSDIDRISLTLQVQLDAATSSSDFFVSYSAFENVAPIPEPTSLLLLGMVAAGAWVQRRRRRSSPPAL